MQGSGTFAIEAALGSFIPIAGGAKGIGAQRPVPLHRIEFDQTLEVAQALQPPGKGSRRNFTVELDTLSYLHLVAAPLDKQDSSLFLLGDQQVEAVGAEIDTGVHRKLPEHVTPCPGHCLSTALPAATVTTWIADSSPDQSGQSATAGSPASRYAPPRWSEYCSTTRDFRNHQRIRNRQCLP